jgi:hypothetical protein
MLEELINQQWQALAKLFRGGKRLGQMAMDTVSERNDTQDKRSLSQSIGSNPQSDALDAYRRRFASTLPPPPRIAPPTQPTQAPPPPGQGFAEQPFPPFKPAPQGDRNANPHPRDAYSERVQRHQAHSRKAPANDWGSRVDNSLDEAWGALASALGRSKGVITTIIICGVFFGGAYAYRTLKGGRADIVSAPRAVPPAETTQTPQPVRSVEARPQKPAHPSSSKKTYYDRLTSEESSGASTPAVSVQMTAGDSSPAKAESQGPAKTAQAGSAQAPAAAQPVQTAALAAAPHAPAAQQPTKTITDAPAQKAELSASEPVIPAKPAVAPQPAVQTASAEPAAKSAQAPLRERPAAASAPLAQIAPTLQAAHALTADKPIVVRGERYLPDGTRIDATAPAAEAQGSSGLGEARAPVLASAAHPIATAQPVSAAPQAAVEAPVAALATPVATAPAAPEPAAPVAAVPLSGYFAQVKSDQNRKAAEAELSTIAEKYGTVLGQIPLSTREADLKDRGIWFRVLAGPVKSHDDADNLCKRLKGAGVQACIVQKFD